MNPNHREWRCELPATLDAVEQFCREFHVWRRNACAELNSFSVELLLREALTNSVLHGSRSDPRKRIFCSLRAKRDRLIMAVRDQGHGFDWRGAFRCNADPAENHGRGIEIFRKYANLVRFNREGNSVTLIKRFEATSI